MASPECRPSKKPRMASPRNPHSPPPSPNQPTGLVDMSEYLDQIHTNKKYYDRHVSPMKPSRAFFMRSTKSSPDLGGDSTSPTGPNGLQTELPPVTELDVDPDKYMLLCLPFQVMTLAGIRRRIVKFFNDLFWQRPPLPCVTTTCGPIYHVRSCDFHPLSGNMPYNMLTRRSLSLPLVNKIRRSESLPVRPKSSSPSDSTLSTSKSVSSPSSPSPSSAKSEKTE